MAQKIDPFLDEKGRVELLPGKSKTRLEIYRYLSGKFEMDKNYTEKEVNEIITQWNTIGDYFILRRGLVDHGFLGRTPNGASYWLIPQEEKEEK